MLHTLRLLIKIGRFGYKNHEKKTFKNGVLTTTRNQMHNNFVPVNS